MTKLTTTTTVLTSSKLRKRQTDRLLKQLPLSERHRQQQIRQQIAHDLHFAAV